MTRKEALVSVVRLSGLPDNAVEKALLDNGITGSGTYTSADKVLINTAAIDLLNGLLVSSVSEGGYSISYDRSAIENLLVVLKGEEAIEGVPGIKGLRNLW